MKKGSFLLVAFILSFSLFGQQLSPQQLIDSMLASMKRFEAGYICRSYTDINGVFHQANTVSNGSFDSLYRRATNRILVSSQDVLTNGRAATLDFNESTKKIGVNYAWFREGGNNILNVGFSAEDASSRFFSLFGKDGWRQGFTVNVGGASKILAKTILFDPDTCDALKQKRQHIYGSILAKVDRIARIHSDTIAAWNARKLAYQQFQIGNATGLASFPQPLTKQQTEDLALWNTIHALSVGPRTDTFGQSVYKPEIESFEVANFKNFGYRVHWLNYGLNFGLKRFSIYDQSLISLAKIDKTNIVRYGASLAYSLFQESSSGHIFYLSADGAINNTNFLEEILPVQIDTLRTQLPSTANELVAGADALVVDQLSRYKKEYALATLGVVTNYFPSFGRGQRLIGGEFAFSTKLKFGNPKDLPARDLFTVRAGILFVYEKAKLAKTTLGLIAEFRDVQYQGKKTSIDDTFSIGLRLGVPFNY